MTHPDAPDAPAVGAKIGNAVIARVAALDRYAGHFKTARALKRRLVLITGPTNSANPTQRSMPLPRLQAARPRPAAIARA